MSDIDDFMKFQKEVGGTKLSYEDYKKWQKSPSKSDFDALIKRSKKEKPREKKIFNIGDTIVCIETKQGKLPQDAYEYLLTYKYFTVLDVNDKLNIDIGHITVDTHNPFFFGPNRFELKEGTAPKKIVGEEDSKVEDDKKVFKDALKDILPDIPDEPWEDSPKKSTKKITKKPKNIEVPTRYTAVPNGCGGWTYTSSC